MSVQVADKVFWTLSASKLALIAQGKAPFGRREGSLSSPYGVFSAAKLPKKRIRIFSPVGENSARLCLQSVRTLCMSVYNKVPTELSPMTSMPFLINSSAVTPSPSVRVRLKVPSYIVPLPQEGLFSLSSASLAPVSCAR